MDLSYKIIRYQPEFKKQVVELQTYLWSPSVALNTAYFEWKYEQNPYLDEKLIYLVLHDGKVIGMRGFFGVEWEAGLPPQKFPSLYADDLVIAPEHRSRGLARRIIAESVEDLSSRGDQYVYNLSAGPATFHTSLSVGWRSAGSMQPMHWRTWQVIFQERLHCFMKRLPMLWRYADRLFFWFSEKRRRLNLDIHGDPVKHRFNAVPWISIEINPRCTAMAELVERIGSHGHIRHVRDQKYFEWRFRNPLRRYWFLFWEKARLEGYLVLMEDTPAINITGGMCIVDWEATSPQVRAELLGAALNVARNKELIIWSATMPGEAKILLEENGFRLVKAEGVRQKIPAVLVRPIRTELLKGDWLLADRRLLDLANWELHMIYSMQG